MQWQTVYEFVDVLQLASLESVYLPLPLGGARACVSVFSFPLGFAFWILAMLLAKEPVT